MLANIETKIYKCPHGRQCKSRCKECLGHSVYKNKCSRCHKKFEPNEEDIKINDKPIQTCYDCRKPTCPHGIRNKSKCKECVNEYRKNYRKKKCPHNKRKDRCCICDYNEFLVSKLRIYVNRAVKQNRTYKSSIEYLGCTIKEYKEYIEKQFKDDMNWDNYGKWHIDHIVPLKYNNPSLEEIKERLHYTNTQPLWALENIIKGNRFIG